MAEQAAKIETLMAIVNTLVTQNEMILQILKQEKKLEETVKVQVEEVLENQRQQEDRKNNLVVFNVEESGAPEEEKSHDLSEIKSILRYVCPDVDVDSVEEAEIFRLGQRKPPAASNAKPKPRPIKIKFKSTESKTSALRQARKLKDHKKYNRIGLAADKTQREREADKALRTEMMRRRSDEEDVYTRGGKLIISKKEKQKQEEGEGAASGSQAHHWLNRTSMKATVHNANFVNKPSHQNSYNSSSKCMSTNADQLPNKNEQTGTSHTTGKFWHHCRNGNPTEKAWHNIHNFTLVGYTCLTDTKGWGVSLFVKNNMETVRLAELEEIFSPSIICKASVSPARASY